MGEGLECLVSGGVGVGGDRITLVMKTKPKNQRSLIESTKRAGHGEGDFCPL